MGERERQDAEKVRAGKPILNIKTPTLLELLKEFLLYPYTAFKNWRKRQDIRKRLFGKVEPVKPVSDDVKKNWAYKAATQGINTEDHGDWLTDLLKEESKHEEK